MDRLWWGWNRIAWPYGSDWPYGLPGEWVPRWYHTRTELFPFGDPDPDDDPEPDSNHAPESALDGSIDAGPAP